MQLQPGAGIGYRATAADRASQKVASQELHKKRILFFHVRSRNVYENKENKDKMSGEKPRICVNLWTIGRHFALSVR
jgi:hypothetical protein